ncbi:Crp/Fnr family transcriptional regulator [Puia dinghuensis]|nr:Crp/Fnr family transcriptional regulator [Puia dinghuensis]
MEPLIRLLHAVHPLSPALEAHLRLKIKCYQYKKGQKIVKAGEIASHILYLEKGLIRSYSLVQGKRISNYFMREGDIIISVESFLQQIPAHDSIEALEDCICWGITFEELEETYAFFPEFNVHGRLITGTYYCRSEARHRGRHRKRSHEIYAALMESDPNLVSRVKDVYMASYLNASKATLSRVKHAYAKRKWR